jgi:iron(III) transport system permease protein
VTSIAARRPWGRLAYHARVARHDPGLVLGVVFAVALAYLVIAPIGAIVLDALLVHSGDRASIGGHPGDFTAYYVQRVFVEPVSRVLFWAPLWNTLSVAATVTLLALGLGGVLAWLVVRTDLRGSRWLATALVVPYMMPSWTFALAWLTLFKNRRVGGQPGFAETLGFASPDWLAYGFVPIAVTLTFHYFPFAFLLIGNALRRVDSQLEESARILGARPRTIARRIVVPLLLPAVMSVVLLTFSKVVGTFGTPYVLGLPTNYSVLSTSLYASFSTGDSGTTAMITVVVVGLGVGLLLADLWLLREFRRFVTVGTKGSLTRQTRLGRWRGPASIVAVLVVVATVAAPLVTLLLSTVMRVPGRFTLENFTLDFWIASRLETSVGFPQGVLRSPDLLHAAWNSLSIVGLAAVVCGVFGLLVGYLVVRTPSRRISAFLRQASFLPYLVPGIAFAAAYLSLFAVARGPIPALYGTTLLLVLVLVVYHLPYASRAGISAMLQLGREPEEAAQVAGAGWFRRVGLIVVPILKGALLTGILLPFISGMKELSAIIMLATPGTDVLTTLSVRLVDYGYTPLANAVVLILVVVTFAATFLAQRLTGSSLASGLER